MSETKTKDTGAEAESLDTDERIISISPIHDQGDRPNLQLNMREIVCSDFLKNAADDLSATEFTLINVQSYLSIMICVEYMKLCARSPEGEIKKMDVKTLTDNKYEAFLSDDEANFIRSIEASCENTATFMKVLSMTVKDANYLGMPHFVVKLCGVISTVILNLSNVRDITKEMLARAVLPTGFKYTISPARVINLIKSVDGLDTRINKAYVVDTTPIKSLDDSDDEDEDVPKLEKEDHSDLSEEDHDTLSDEGTKTSKKTKAPESDLDSSSNSNSKSSSKSDSSSDSESDKKTKSSKAGRGKAASKKKDIEVKKGKEKEKEKEKKKEKKSKTKKSKVTKKKEESDSESD